MGAIALFAMSACGGPVDEQLGEEELVASVSSPIVVGTWSDAVGGSAPTMFVNLYQCSWTALASSNTATCAVGSSDVLVGGGAEIQGEGSPGALLTGSYPDQGGALTTWVASSASSQTNFSHRLRAYAVGLQLVGMSASSLRASMFQSFATSGAGSNPSVQVGVASTRVLVGGGARAVTANQFLTASYPLGGVAGRWTAISKDHITSAPGTVRAYAIGVLRCPSGYVGGCLTSQEFFSSISSPSGYSMLMKDGSGTGAMTSIGADVRYNGAGRMLTDLHPFLQTSAPPLGSLARSKDHVIADTGSLFSEVLRLRKL